MPGYYFILPRQEVLTTDQQAALNEPEHIALSGGPGTGKSVVSMWRHISNYNQGRHSLLLTYTTTLKRYLQACCRSRNQSAATRVGTSLRNQSLTQNQPCYEVIIDEAQDLAPSFYSQICSPVSYGADDSQILYPTRCSTQNQLAALFPNNVSYVLSRNFRSTREIMQFVKRAFPIAAISNSMINNITRTGNKPSLLIGNWLSRINTPVQEVNAILQIINDLRNDTENIAILVPWKSAVQNYASVLQNHIDGFSYYYEDPTIFPNGCPDLKNVHITTFKSAKGLEFDHVILADGEEEFYPDTELGKHCLYTAISRATRQLAILANGKLAENIKK